MANEAKKHNAGIGQLQAGPADFAKAAAILATMVEGIEVKPMVQEVIFRRRQYKDAILIESLPFTDSRRAKPLLERFTPIDGRKYPCFIWDLRGRLFAFPVVTMRLTSEELQPPSQSIREVVFQDSRKGKAGLVAFSSYGKVILPARGCEFVKGIKVRVAMAEKPRLHLAYEVPEELREGPVDESTALVLVKEIGAALPSDAYTIYFDGRRYEAFHYLGLREDATLDEVKKVFRDRAKREHQDAAVKIWESSMGMPASPAVVAELTQASELLNQCYERAEYICNHKAAQEREKVAERFQCKARTRQGKRCKNQKVPCGGDYCGIHQEYKVDEQQVQEAAEAVGANGAEEVAGGVEV